jgi:glycerate kinase
MRIVAACDKFRGTASARAVVDAIAEVARARGIRCDAVPLADGGEGTLAALGGPNRTAIVTGPLGDPVEAAWRLSGKRAVIEMARASGIELVGGAEGNDPVAASTTGTGELIALAIDSGATSILVGVGGSATTDGGFGALRAMYPLQRLRGIDLSVACDVRTTFVDAAAVFAPQKGASPVQVEFLRRRLERLAQVYLAEHGVDVRDLPGSGAAGGLAGGLAAIGATLVDGFELVADACELDLVIGEADLVVTGEGFVDAQSFEGKVVGGVVAAAQAAGVPALVIAGDVYDAVEDRHDLANTTSVSLADRFGLDSALADPLGGVRRVLEEYLDLLPQP